MLWDKIKKAINSTIGTPNFKPLNEIVEYAFSNVTEKQNETQKNLSETQEKLISGENNFTVQYANTYKNMVLGSYVGDGNHFGQPYSTYKNTLTFPFVPKLVVVQGAGGIATELFMVNGTESVDIPVLRENNTGGFYTYTAVTVSWSGNTVTWHTVASERAGEQFNAKDSTYRYIAFG